MKKNNSFEKEVQEILKENEFLPSDELWGKIKTDLQKDKKRAIIWFYSRIAAGFLLLMGFTFVFVNYYDYFLDREASLTKNNSKSIFSDSINKNRLPIRSKNKYQTKTNFNSSSNSKNNVNLFQPSKSKTNSNSSNESTKTYLSELPFASLPFLQSIKPTLNFLALQKQSIPYLSIPSPSLAFIEEQKEEKKKEKKSTHSFGLTFSGSPSYFSYTPQIDKDKILAQTKNSSVSKSSIQNIQNIETTFKPDFSYTFSLKGSYELNKHIILETGIQYMHVRSQIQTNGVWEDNLLDQNYACITTPPADIQDIRDSYYADSQSFPTGADQSSSYYPLQLNTTKKLTLKDSYHYMSIPLKIGYVVGNGKIGCVVFGSLAPELLLRNRWDSKGSDAASVDQYTTTRTVNVSSGVSLSMNYKLTKQFSFVLEPSYRVFLFNTSRNEILNTKNPQIVNMEVGLKYAF